MTTPLSPPEVPFIRVDEVPLQDDFTLLVPVGTPDEWKTFLYNCCPDSFRSLLQQLPATGNVPVRISSAINSEFQARKFSISETIQMGITANDPIIEGRALICLCNRGNHLSI